MSKIDFEEALEKAVKIAEKQAEKDGEDISNSQGMTGDDGLQYRGYYPSAQKVLSHMGEENPSDERVKEIAAKIPWRWCPECGQTLSYASLHDYCQLCIMRD